MEQPTYVRRLLNQKVLLIIGFVVAVVAGLLAGFTIVDGEVQPRAARVYTASSTILLSSPQPDYFQVEIPETTQALPQPVEGEVQQELIVNPATPINLSDSAIILAYMASSDLIADAVAAEIGGFADGESVVAVQRTTPPTGTERFPGRLSLPIIEIAGTANSAERAELIAATATAAFAAYVEQQQTEWGVAEDIRLVLDQLNAPVADSGEGSNPVIPVIVVAFGVFLLFIALALIIEAIRDRRRVRRSAPDQQDDSDSTDSTTDPSTVPWESADVPEHDRVPVGAGPRRRSARRAVASEADAAGAAELVSSAEDATSTRS